MEISEEVKEMSLIELQKLRAKIKEQLIVGEITMDDYVRGDMELVNLLLLKESKAS